MTTTVKEFRLSEFKKRDKQRSCAITFYREYSHGGTSELLINEVYEVPEGFVMMDDSRLRPYRFLQDECEVAHYVDCLNECLPKKENFNLGRVVTKARKLAKGY